MCLQTIPETSLICTVIIADANQDAWSAIVLKLLRSTDPPHPDEFDDLRAALTEALNENCNPSVIVPVRICGHRFPTAMRKLSSTYRERAAVLYTLGECKALVEGPAARSR